MIATRETELRDILLSLSVCPPGLYGPYCAERCQCGDQCPCDPLTGSCSSVSGGRLTGGDAPFVLNYLYHTTSTWRLELMLRFHMIVFFVQVFTPPQQVGVWLNRCLHCGDNRRRLTETNRTYQSECQGRVRWLWSYYFPHPDLNSVCLREIYHQTWSNNTRTLSNVILLCSRLHIVQTYGIISPLLHQSTSNWKDKFDSKNVERYQAVFQEKKHVSIHPLLSQHHGSIVLRDRKGKGWLDSEISKCILDTFIQAWKWNRLSLLKCSEHTFMLDVMYMSITQKYVFQWMSR